MILKLQQQPKASKFKLLSLNQKRSIYEFDINISHKTGTTEIRFKVVVAGQCCDVRVALQNVGSMPSPPRKLCCARTECELGALCVRERSHGPERRAPNTERSQMDECFHDVRTS